MGKDYKKELDKLDTIYTSACKAEIKTISDFISKYIEFPCLCVGSGGSYSVASIFEYLFTQNGGFAKSITPIELSNYHTQIKNLVSVLFTAGGRNNDSLNAYRYLSESEPKGLLTLCMSIDAPIKKIQQSNIHNHYYEYKMPVRKDGYLAVESIVSCLVILCRAFEETTHNSFFHIPNSIDWNANLISEQQAKYVFNKETIIVLHGGITTPAAIDLESKFGETSLGNIQLVDFRNFAHGRHFWLEDRKDKTAIISLSSKSVESIFEKTLGLLPAEIPILRFVTDDNSVIGLFESFRYVFNIVLQAGIVHGLNPGKPKVAEFGKKLYHMNYNICNSASIRDRQKDILKMSIYRKAKSLTKTDERILLQYAQKNYDHIIHSIYKGIVLDFDGTIYDKNYYNLYTQICTKLVELVSNGIIVGIATGRGKSIRLEMQKHIPKVYWESIYIAYYNGGCVGTLSDDHQPDKKSQSDSYAFSQVKSIISNYSKEHSTLHIDGIDDNNPYQITVLSDNNDHNLIDKLKINLQSIRGIKIVESSHSFDIIPDTSSKNNIFDYLITLGYSKNDFIAIGDAGHQGGNDYELLSQPDSLSVDQVSENVLFCWNYSKPGLRNLEATLFYLDNIQIHKGYFTFKR